MVVAVVGMIGTFFALAGLFLMLYATFLAAIQVLVYAGAIMVLFVFVVMILNKSDDSPWAVRGRRGWVGKAIVGLSLLYLFVRLSQILWTLRDARPYLPAPLPAVEPVRRSGVLLKEIYEFGSVRGVGHTLFTDYLFPFEAVSLVLLVAVVGAIALARPVRETEEKAIRAYLEADR